MQVTIGAKCWDGCRTKLLSELIPVKETEGLSKIGDPVGKIINNPKIKALLGFTIPLAFLSFGMPPFGLSHAVAASIAPEAAVPVMMSDAVKMKILHAFDPLIGLIQSLSYPIAGVMIAGGCLFIMVGNRERGMQMLQNAAIGYILVQLSPMILELLVGIGNSV